MANAKDSRDIEDMLDLNTMLALGDRELAFLRDHFGGRTEAMETPSGKEFLETLDLARFTLARFRSDLTDASGTRGDQRAVQRAAAIARRNET